MTAPITGEEAERRLRCWVLSDGRAGSEAQSLGLAEALGLKPEVKRLEVRAPWRWLPPGLWPRPLGALAAGSAPLAPPRPELVIACGRLTAAPAAALRRAGQGAVRAVQIQDSKLAPGRFDLVIVPAHDRLRGPNVLTSLGALNLVTPARLAEAAEGLTGALSELPRPRVAVLVGGSSKVHRQTPALARRLGCDLAALARDEGAGLMVTVSRRTGEAATAGLREALAGTSAVFWDGQGENPYFGYLGLADAILVTEDSVTMASEAVATRKPVQVIALEGGSAKFHRFHEALRAGGHTRPFAGRLERWQPPPLDETARIAAEVRRRLDLPWPEISERRGDHAGLRG
jgi:mitochondrial fission protein ELM1